MSRVSRKTKQKEALQKLIKTQDGFFTAQGLATQTTIGIATIYRHLKQAEKNGLIHGYRCDGKRIYSQEHHTHAHFIDDKTGETVHFSIQDLGPIIKAAPGDACHVQIEVHGTLKHTTKD